jgi:phosphatidylglycerol:prolipoprotein diacylglycerol transferase
LLAGRLLCGAILSPIVLKHPDINPVAISIGPLSIHWYGIMYLVGFAAGWWLGRRRASVRPGWDAQQVGDLVFYIALGVVIGGRLGYVLFYDLPSYLASPLDVFKLWRGGMSFHGGLIGVIIAMWLFARHRGRPFFDVADFVAPLVPIGLGAGRIGNFINGELWGKVTTLPWGMVFPGAGPLPRHPSELYEALLEGAVLFIILWTYSRKPRPLMSVSGLFLLFYGIFRFLIEFVRVPDVQLGYLAGGWLTMGQILSTPMIVIGAFMLWWSHRKPQAIQKPSR